MANADQTQLIELNRKQLQAYDERLLELEKEVTSIRAQRAALAAFLTQLTGEAQSAPPVPITSGKADDGTAEEGVGRSYVSRAYNRKVVDEAMRIVVERGAPMTAAEIITQHSMRKEVATETLYRLIYNRVIAEKIYSFAGAFWPADKPVPAGWNLSLAKRGRRKAEQNA
jgi:hypothetical protein